MEASKDEPQPWQQVGVLIPGSPLPYNRRLGFTFESAAVAAIEATAITAQ